MNWTQEEILEYNKRCAEFLGLKRGWWISQQKPLTDDKKQWWDIDEKTFLGTRVYYDKDLLFHSDWNWIMEVVEAIEKLRYLVVIQSNFCQIQEVGKKENSFSPRIIAYQEALTKKEAVVQAINQFLIWYNNE
jgi:hypothetical protein